jgi:hypothetical protein
VQPGTSRLTFRRNALSLSSGSKSSSRKQEYLYNRLLAYFSTLKMQEIRSSKTSATSTKVHRIASQNITHTLHSHDKCLSLTSSGVWGATMEPIRPTMAHTPSSECRSSVGNISVVYTYTTVKDIVMENLPSKNSSIRSQSRSTQNQITATFSLAI